MRTGRDRRGGVRDSGVPAAAGRARNRSDRHGPRVRARCTCASATPCIRCYNLASARLIAGSPREPELVSASAVDAAKRGPLVGIPGAPTRIARPLDGDESDWTVCEDATATTTVIVGEAQGRLDPPQNVLVTARGESAATTYLLYDGRRGQGRPAQSRRRPCAEAGRDALHDRFRASCSTPCRRRPKSPHPQSRRSAHVRCCADSGRYRGAADSRGFRRVLRRARRRCAADRRGRRGPHQVHPTARPTRHRHASRPV